MKKLIELLRNTLHLNVHSINRTLDYSKPIPFIIKKSFEISIIEIENLECLVLSINEDEIKSIKKHLAIFKESLSQPIIINVNNISVSTRKYLIENGISFVSQDAVYLPQFLIYFENLSNKPKLKKKKLSKLAQTILISELLQNQKRTMKDDFIKVGDIINYKLLKATSRQSFHNWIKNDTIKEHEYEKDVNNRNTLSISRTCLLRLQKEKK